jgi:integrase
MASVKYLPKSSNPRARKPYTLRYWDTNGQHERSFTTVKERKDFAVKFEHDSRESIFIDPKLGSVTFGEYARRWVDQHQGAPGTKLMYSGLLRNHVGPELGNRTLRQVATGREDVKELLTETLPAKGLGAGRVKLAYVLINAVVDEAVRAGRVPASKIKGIPLTAGGEAAEFVFPDHGQLSALAAKMPAQWSPAIWLMRGCGLRLGEALAVRADSFREGRTVLRIVEQVRPGDTHGPLKHRRADQYRDLPVPAYVAERVAEHLTEHGTRDGYLFGPLPGHKGFRRNFEHAFNRARDAAGLPETFTIHDLRHVFASIALSHGIPITDVSKWLGHANVNTTYRIYSHFVPSSFDRAREVLDAEHTQWAKPEAG